MIRRLNAILVEGDGAALAVCCRQKHDFEQPGTVPVLQEDRSGEIVIGDTQDRQNHQPGAA